METWSKGKQCANPEPGPSCHRSPTTLYTLSEPPNPSTDVPRIEELPEDAPVNSGNASEAEGTQPQQSQPPQQPQWPQTANEAA
jgi:hypothetical protein